jgi:pimeloyl-ACP methyl ester carboxylesterase
MTADFLATEVLGTRLGFRPLDVQTPDGLRVSAQDWGGGQGGVRDVLLVHGISQAYLCWFKQLAAPLRERYRFVTYDLRGHGGSQKPLSGDYYQNAACWAGEVQAVIETAGLERPVIVAWSYGGRVALDFVQAAGDEAIAGLVLVAGTSTDDPSLFGTGAPLLERMATVTDVSENLRTTREFLQACVAGPLPAAESELMLAYNLMVPPEVRAAMGGRPAAYRAVLAGIRSPVLAIHGDQDRITLPAMAHYTASHCPRGRAIVYEGVGHSPFWEAPERFNADLAAYLEALPPLAGVRSVGASRFTIPPGSTGSIIG